MDMDCRCSINFYIYLNPVGRDYIKRHSDIEKEMDRYPYKAVITVIVLLTLIFA